MNILTNLSIFALLPALAGCGQAEPPKPLATQQQALEQAKQVETVLDAAAAQQRREIDQQSQ